MDLISKRLRGELFDAVKLIKNIPSDLTCEDCAIVHGNNGSIWLQTFEQDLNTERWLKSESGLKNHGFLVTPDWSDSTMDFKLDVEGILGELYSLIEDKQFRNEVVEAFTHSRGSDSFYNYLKRRSPSPSHNSQKVVEYDESDFFAILCGHVDVDALQYNNNVKLMRRDLVDRNLMFILEKYEEYAGDTKLVDEPFFDEAFRLVHKYRLTNNYDRFFVEIEDDGKILFVESDNLEPEESYHSIEINNLTFMSLFERAFCVGDIREYSSTPYVVITFQHPENQAKYQDCTVIGYSFDEAVEFLEQVYEDSIDLISGFDSRRAQSMAERHLAELCVKDYNTVVDGGLYKRVSHQFVRDCDNRWKLDFSTIEEYGIVTDDIRSRLSELTSVFS